MEVETTEDKGGWLNATTEDPETESQEWEDIDQGEDIIPVTPELTEEMVETIGDLPDIKQAIADKIGDLPGEAIEPLVSRLLSLVETQREIIPAKADLKDSKALAKSHEDKISRLDDYSSELLAEIRSILAGEIPEEADEPISSGAGGDDWRSCRTDSLGFEKLPRMGRKKYEALVELAPTIGELEDIRGEASRKGVPFASVLPQGIGEALASGIEEKILDQIGKGIGI